LSAWSSVAATSLSDIVCGFQMPPFRAETTSDLVGTRRSERSVSSVEPIGLYQPETQSPNCCPLERGGDCAFRLGRAVRSGSSLAVWESQERKGIRRRLSTMGQHLESTDYVGQASRRYRRQPVTANCQPLTFVTSQRDSATNEKNAAGSCLRSW
jgi:hypothetical protein